MTGAAAAAVARTHRREWAALLAPAVRLLGDLDLAEECVQEAYAAALTTWEERGVPANPAAWLVTATRNRALDVLRRRSTAGRKLGLLGEPDEHRTDDHDDDRLGLVFLCAHPALAPEARLALTLRMVGGLTTSEVAAAFLVPEATAAARITRAKKKVAAARIPFRTPPPEQWPERLDAVLTVVHLVFTTGHTAPAGDALVRPDLVALALRLARLLHELMPTEREVVGLLALLVLTDARRRARCDAAGRLVLLDSQDRSLWNRAALDEGRALVRRALTRGRPAPPGRFALQAAVAAVHADAPSWADTDWPQIVQLYDVLLRVWPTPVVALNRAAARSWVDGPDRALADLDALAADPRLAGYPYLPATRADLLRRAGRSAEARAEYRAALRLTANSAEREFLQRRLAELDP